MYKLTLSADDRSAIDWVGNRYSHGDDLFKAIMGGDSENKSDCWSESEGDITFILPEAIAWDVTDIINGSNLDCFGEALCRKLRSFADRIV